MGITEVVVVKGIIIIMMVFLAVVVVVVVDTHHARINPTIINRERATQRRALLLEKTALIKIHIIMDTRMDLNMVVSMVNLGGRMDIMRIGVGMIVMIDGIMDQHPTEMVKSILLTLAQ